MTVVGRGTVDGSKKVELGNDFGWLEAKNLLDGIPYFFFRRFFRTETIDGNTRRVRIPDCVSDLNLHSVSQSGGDDVLATQRHM